MRIRKVALKNLNSLVGEFELDLENGPIGESGLFAITGPTGAGKTTLLDAITLGLYGKAARYENDRNPSDVMSRGTSESYAEVSFESSRGCFVARWRLARARGNPDGNVQPPRREIADADGVPLATKVTEVDELIVALTGLDYSRFLRSVLLAQGRFHEFLLAKPADRGDVLQSITGTEIYAAIGRLSHAAAKEREDTIREERLKLEGIRLLSDDERKAREAENDRLLREREETEKLIEGLRDYLQLFESWHKEESEKARLEGLSKELDVRLKDFEADRKLLERHEQVGPLASELRLWEAGAKRIEEDEELLSRRSGEEAKASLDVIRNLAAALAVCRQSSQTCDRDEVAQLQERKECQARIIDVQQAMEGLSSDRHLEEALPQIRELGERCRELAAQTLALVANMRKEKREIHQIKLELYDIDEKVTGTGSALERATALVEQEESVLAQALEGLTRKDWETREVLLREAAQCEKECRREMERGAEIQTRRNEVERDLETVSARRVEVEEKLQVERARLADKQTIHEQALLIATLDEHRATLQDGKPCPLCGAEEHPFASGQMPSEMESMVALATQGGIVDELVAERDEVTKKEAGLKWRLRSLDEQATDISKRAYNLLPGMRHLCKILAIPIAAEFGHLDDLEKEFDRLTSEVQKRLKQVEASEAKLRTLREEKQVAAGAAEKYHALAAELHNRLKAARGRVSDWETNRDMIEELAVDMRNTFNVRVAEFSGHATEPEETREVVKVLESRQRQWATWAGKESTLKARIAALGASLEQLRRTKSDLEAETREWTQRLDATGSGTVPRVEAIPPDMETETGRRKAVNEAVTRRAELLAEIATLRELLTRTRSEHKEAGESLEAGLREYGFSDLESLKAAVLPPEQLEALTVRRRSLNEERLRLDALRQQNREDLEALLERNPPNREQAAGMRLKLEQAQRGQEERLGRLGELRGELEADRRDRATQHAKFAQIEALERGARPWIELKKLIGSADGGQFSQFALGLTLWQLVNAANRHLLRLAPRYRIRRVEGDDLELEMVDTYQADITRPVRSLSGGESFLVSLALALGLSELAGRHSRIESLFIDEGFGSLDAESLDVALSALENLRLENRTIGVISHVESMKSRIGTQVRVDRNAEGQARVTLHEG